MGRRIHVLAVAATAAAMLASGCDFFASPGQNAAAELRVLDGDGQTGAAGVELPTRVVVRAVDGDGRYIGGQTVTFEVTAGGGSVSEAGVTTNDSGVASTSWTLGTTAGLPQQLAARSGSGATAATATVTASALPGEPDQLIKVEGDGQVAEPGNQLPSPLKVRLADRFGNGIAGRTISWSASSGSVAPAAAETDGSGAATTSWRLGTSVGSYSATASYEGVAPATFSAGTSLGGVTLTKTSGDGQSAQAGTVLPAELVVTLRGSGGQPIEGARITFQASAGTVSTAEMNTAASGEARTRWTMPATVGPVTLTAAAENQAAVTFTATATAGAATSITIVSGNGQAGDVGAALAAPLAVLVRDAAGNPAAGVAVTWTVTAGNGSAAPSPSLTGADGIAQTGWTLGLKADVTHAATASIGGADASFTATPGIPATLTMVKTAGDAQTGTAGAALADSLEVTTRLPDGRLVEGVQVTWSASAGGSIVARAAGTAPDGRLRARWTLGATAGAQTAVARWLDTQGVVRDSVTFTATAQAGGASALAILSGNNQAGDVGATLADSLAVVVRDGAGNPVANASVTWAVAAGGGSVAPTTRLTNANGVARAAWTLGLKADVTHTATASSGSSSVVFQATPRIPATLAFTKTLGDGQSAPAGSALPDSLEVTAKLADGRAVEGVRVTWSAAGGGTIVARADRTAPSGTVRARWTLANVTGTQRAVARWLDTQGAVRDSVVFTANAVAGSAASVSVYSGNDQSGDVGAALADSIAVIVRDATGTPLSGAAVTWSVTAGFGSVSPASVTTNALGVARARWTLGLKADVTHTAAASAGGATPASFSATPTIPATLVMVKTLGDGQTGVAGAALADSLAVTTRLADGRAVEGVKVTWTPVPGGTIAARSDGTAPDGTLRARWTLGTRSGAQTGTARWLSTAGVPQDSVIFTATATSPSGAPRTQQ